MNESLRQCLKFGSRPVRLMKRTGLEKSLPAFRGDKRHDGDCAGAFNCNSQFSLMLGTVSRDSAGHDLAALRDEVVEDHRVFEVDLNIGVRAEPAEFFSVEKFLLGRTGGSFAVGYCHDYSPFGVLSSLVICFL